MREKIFSILYNRGVYPEESFAKVKKYGLPMLLTQDEGVKSFMANLTAQLSGKFDFPPFLVLFGFWENVEKILIMKMEIEFQ